MAKRFWSHLFALSCSTVGALFKFKRTILSSHSSRIWIDEDFRICGQLLNYSSGDYILDVYALSKNGELHIAEAGENDASSFIRQGRLNNTPSIDDNETIYHDFRVFVTLTPDTIFTRGSDSKSSEFQLSIPGQPIIYLEAPADKADEWHIAFCKTLNYVKDMLVFRGFYKDDMGNAADINAFETLHKASLWPLILSFLGTKASYGICRSFQQILLGTEEKRGIGCFFLCNTQSMTNEGLKFFSHVKKLRYHSHGTRNVTDISVLGRIPELNLSNLRYLTDVSPLASVHTLSLWGFLAVQDISALGKVNTLTLFGFPYVTDVSALGNVCTLKLHNFPNVTDVSALGKVHHLTLHNVGLIRDVSALGTTHSLFLRSMNQVTDVSALGKVHTLSLSRMKHLNDVSALGRVHTLELVSLWNLRYVSALRTVHTLKLMNNPLVTDVSSLGTVHNLYLYGMPHVVDVSALRTVHDLTLYNMVGIIDISALVAVNSLTLRRISDNIDSAAVMEFTNLTSSCDLRLLEVASIEM